jgi:hypothetical protein
LGEGQIDKARRQDHQGEVKDPRRAGGRFHCEPFIMEAQYQTVNSGLQNSLLILSAISRNIPKNEERKIISKVKLF